MGDARHFLVHRATPELPRLTPFATPPSFAVARDAAEVARDMAQSLQTPLDEMAAQRADTARTPDAGAAAEDLKPQNLNANHQDAVFGNAFGSRPYYVVHPEWISEAGSDPQPDPLSRPPWPWEQPRYRVNMQVPLTYSAPASASGARAPVDAKAEEEAEEDRYLQQGVPPVSYQLSHMYKTTHPEYVPRL